jgi:hypothetical protein
VKIPDVQMISSWVLNYPLESVVIGLAISPLTQTCMKDQQYREAATRRHRLVRHLPSYGTHNPEVP